MSNLIAIQFGYMSIIRVCLWNTDHQVLKQPFCILSKMLQLTPCLTVIIPSPETIGTEKLTSARFFIPPFSYYRSCWRIASIIVNRYLNTIISISTENVIFISSVQFSNAVCANTHYFLCTNGGCVQKILYRDIFAWWLYRTLQPKHHIGLLIPSWVSQLISACCVTVK